MQPEIVCTSVIEKRQNIRHNESALFVRHCHVGYKTSTLDQEEIIFLKAQAFCSSVEHGNLHTAGTRSFSGCFIRCLLLSSFYVLLFDLRTTPNEAR